MIIMITTVLYLATEGINENRNIHINDKSPNSIGSQRATEKYLKINHNMHWFSMGNQNASQSKTQYPSFPTTSKSISSEPQYILVLKIDRKVFQNNID